VVVVVVVEVEEDSEVVVEAEAEVVAEVASGSLIKDLQKQLQKLATIYTLVKQT